MYAVIVETEGDQWVLDAAHTILLSEATISPARTELTAIADQAGGEDDRWDADADAAVA